MNEILSWFDYSIDELSSRKLYALLKLRVDVFVVEQRCPYAELDGLDLIDSTRQIFALNTGGEAVAAGRVLDASGAQPLRIGRVVVAAAFRGTGLSTTLMDRLMQSCQDRYPSQVIELSAQVGVEKLYAAYGFRQISEIYFEDGIPHRNMRFVPS
jgi:ElaA protein